MVYGRCFFYCAECCMFNAVRQLKIYCCMHCVCVGSYLILDREKWKVNCTIHIAEAIQLFISMRKCFSIEYIVSVYSPRESLTGPITTRPQTIYTKNEFSLSSLTIYKKSKKCNPTEAKRVTCSSGRKHFVWRIYPIHIIVLIFAF